MSDAHGVVHVLEPSTGRQRSELTLGFPVDAACPAPDGSPRVLVARHAVPWSESPGPLMGMLPHEIARLQNVMIDPAAGTSTPASIHTFCDWSTYCRRGEQHDCRVLTEQVDAPRKTEFDVIAHMVYRDGDARVGVGTVALAPAGDDAVPQRYVAARWDANTRAIAWKTELSMRGSVMQVQLALGDDIFVALDDTAAGPGRFRALDAKTGAVRFDRELDHAGIGTEVMALFARGDSIYVARSGRLERYDASTGALVSRSDAR